MIGKTETEKLNYCMGCEDNFYNGNNPYGIKECWNLRKAKLVLRKKVSMSQVPPWEQPPIKVLACFKCKGYVFVNPDARY